jgi:hypothetical protein
MAYSTHNYWVFGLFPSSSVFRRMETDPVSETSSLYSLKHRMMEEVQKPSNSVYHLIFREVSIQKGP